MTPIAIARVTLDLLAWIVRRRVTRNLAAIRLDGLGRWLTNRTRPAARHSYGRPGLVRYRPTRRPSGHRSGNVYTARTVLAFAQARTPKGHFA